MIIGETETITWNFWSSILPAVQHMAHMGTNYNDPQQNKYAIVKDAAYTTSSFRGYSGETSMVSGACRSATIEGMCLASEK
jgi:hypothetical protein